MSSDSGSRLPQRVLLVHRFFDPDVTSYAQMLAHFANHLGSLGHNVTVLCGPPSYNGASRPIEVPRHEARALYSVRRLRVPRTDTKLGKLLSYLFFPALVALHCLSRRRAYDVVSVTTIPPVVMGVAGRIGAARSRRTRLVYHCMDLYPEVAEAAGVGGWSLLSKVARAVDTATIRAADPVIVLSEDMRRTVTDRPGAAAEVAVENNFIVEDRSGEAGVELERQAECVLVFAGNIGRFQGLESLLDAIELSSGDGVDVELVFIGAGALEDSIRTQAVERDLPVRVLHHRPMAEAMALMAGADVGIVPLAAGVIRSAYPSKTMTYLEVGLPILALVEDGTELAQIVEEEKIGATAPIDDPRAIADAIVELSIRDIDPEAIRSAAARHFGRREGLERWTKAYRLT